MQLSGYIVLSYMCWSQHLLEYYTLDATKGAVVTVLYLICEASFKAVVHCFMMHAIKRPNQATPIKCQWCAMVPMPKSLRSRPSSVAVWLSPSSAGGVLCRYP